MEKIDFSTLPDIQNRVSSEEIANLNSLFEQSDIQSELEEIEHQRKIRQKYKIWAHVFSIGVTAVLSYFLWDWDLIKGFFYTIGSGDDSFTPGITTLILSYTFSMGWIYHKFSTLIEIPLKKNVLSKMCPLIFSKLEYSHDAQYSFDECSYLVGKWFLRWYTDIDKAEDSIRIMMEKDGKSFIAQWFELETSKVQWSGKNRRRVTTNHDYLIRVEFPNARIPMEHDLFIMKDYLDSQSAWKYVIPLVIGICVGIPAYLFSTSIPIASVVCLIAVVASYFWMMKYKSKNRIALENTWFEKLFDVKCEDPVTSRMILTPAFMDRLTSFVEKTGNEYEFLFESNIIYIKRKIRKEYLEVGTERNILKNVSGFIQFYIDMRELISLIIDLNIVYLSQTKSLEGNRTLEEISKAIIPIAWDFWGSQKALSFQRFSGFFSRFVGKQVNKTTLT